MSRKEAILSNLPQLSLSYREACGEDCNYIAGKAFDAALEEVRKWIKLFRETLPIEKDGEETLDCVEEALGWIQGDKDEKK